MRSIPEQSAAHSIPNAPLEDLPYDFRLRVHDFDLAGVALGGRDVPVRPTAGWPAVLGKQLQLVAYTAADLLAIGLIHAALQIQHHEIVVACVGAGWPHPSDATNERISAASNSGSSAAAK